MGNGGREANGDDAVVLVDLHVRRINYVQVLQRVGMFGIVDASNKVEYDSTLNCHRRQFVRGHRPDGVIEISARGIGISARHCYSAYTGFRVQALEICEVNTLLTRLSLPFTRYTDIYIYIYNNITNFTVNIKGFCLCTVIYDINDLITQIYICRQKV